MGKITNKTRKIIWALSGGSCAICKSELTKKVDQKHLVLGQECHIRSQKLNGPRYAAEYPFDKLNTPDNLILLCRNHHKEIDDFVDKYTVEVLERIKLEHEKLIKNISSKKVSPIKFIKKSRYLSATLVTSGLQLINTALDCSAYSYSLDETDDEEEHELIKSFLDYIEDLDIICETSIGFKLDIARELTRLIRELEKHGYYIFSAVSHDEITGGVIEENDIFNIFYYYLTKNKDIKYIIR